MIQKVHCNELQKSSVDFKGMVVHTAAASHQYTAEVLDADHTDRFGPNGCGYTFVLDFDGTLWCNPIRYDGVGAHARQTFHHKPSGIAVSCNREMIGVCFLGHGDEEPPTEEQLALYDALRDHLMQLYGFDDTWVIGHYLVEPHKTCPGKQIRDLLGL